MMGTGPFAVPTYRQLILSSHEVVCLVTRPLPKQTGQRNVIVTPMRDVAREFGIPIFDPVNVNEPEFIETMRSMNADVLVVCDYGQILSPACLAATVYGGVNLHGSLLPKYRGAAPINWAIYHGEIETGVSVIHLTARLDAGPVICQASLPINESDTAIEIESRLAELGVGLVSRALELLQNWDRQSTLGILQDSQLATRAPRLKRTDGWINWNRSAQQICNQIRAFKPWPGSFTTWQRPGHDELRLIIHEAVSRVSNHGVKTGTVVNAAGGELSIAALDSLLIVQQIQPAGKRQMDAGEFIRGYRIEPGMQLG